MPLRIFTFACALLLAASAGSAWGADGPQSTRKLLTKYGAELVEAWEKYPALDKQKVRQARFQELQTNFTKDIAAAEGPKNETIEVVYNQFLKNLKTGYELFRADKMKAELTQYVRGCGLAFKREVLAATDYGKERTAQDVFKLGMKLLETARNELVIKQFKEARSEAISASQTFLNTFAQNARIPEKGPSPTEQYALNTEEMKKVFPVSSKDLAELNAPFVAPLDQLAKAIQQRASRRQ